MKFILVAPGFSTIPPKGWGAVESIVWDYYQELTQRHDVVIINQSNVEDIITECNLHDGIVHIMYDDHIFIVPRLRASRILYTSHFAYLTNEVELTTSAYFHTIFKKVIEYQSKITLYALSKEIEDVYKKHGYCGRSIVMRNGARTFRTTLTPQKRDRSLYIGKIELRKSQYKYQTIPSIDFVGNYHDSPFTSSNYLGEWDKPTLYDSLTDYGNLLLLSEGEADPLVVKEALMAGLGVVLSECSCANLDLSKEFITVIPNDALNDLDYVTKQLEKNRTYSVSHRQDILEYAKHFSWSTIIKEYVSIVPKKIVLVGPGILPIPPPGWGAVEILMWEYYQELTAQGQEVVIVNPLRKSPLDQQPSTLYSEQLIREINSHKGDLVHIHYDCLHYIIPHLTCPRICITSHFPYIGNEEQYGGYHEVFHALCHNERHSIMAISTKDYEIFKAYALHPEKVYYTPNGSYPLPPLDRNGLYRNKSIYVAKVEPRKKQHVYCCIPNLDFYGKCDDTFRTLPCYKGEKEHGEMVNLMREYGSLVLLSDGENGGPLVIKEALMAGIPVVTNRHSGMEPMPFVDIIPDDKLYDMAYVEDVIQKSRSKDRTGIREYASQFSWTHVVRRYISFFNLMT